MQRRSLEYFVTVVDCGSISAAAQKLLVDQASLSRTIHTMERQMNRQLLERTGRGVSPTDAGQQLYYYARSILDKFQMLERLSQNGDTQLVSRLRVSVAMLILQDDLMETLYHQLHTQGVELCIFETTLEPLIEQVAGGSSELGLAVVNDHQLPLFTRMSQARGLELISLDQARESCVHLHVSPPLAQYQQICCRQLFEYSRVLPPDDFFSHMNQTVRYEIGRPADLPRRTITVNRGHTMLHMLQHTPGYMVSSRWQARTMSASRILTLPLCDAPVMQNLLLVQRRRQSLSGCARQFLKDFLTGQSLPMV